MTGQEFESIITALVNAGAEGVPAVGATEYLFVLAVKEETTIGELESTDVAGVAATYGSMLAGQGGGLTPTYQAKSGCHVLSWSRPPVVDVADAEEQCCLQVTEGDRVLGRWSILA